jgi:hypothetical protein
MKLDDRHQEYTKRWLQWERCRDFLAGTDALIEHDTRTAGAEGSYIERLSSRQSFDEYKAYIRRALYDNTVKRIRNSLIGLVFSKDPIIEIPTGVNYFTNDADLMETPLAEFCESVVSEVMSVGRVGVLVDRPPSATGVSRAETQAAGIRPYFALYKAETIINWKMERVNNRWMVTRVVLDEGSDTIRELTLDDIGYGVTIWMKQRTGEGKPTGEYVTSGRVYPQMNNQPIKAIPFYFFGPQSGSVETVEPPLLDIVNIAKSHYQSSADLEHARFACSVPTPYFLGFSSQEVEGLALGGLNGIHTTSADAKVGYLEYTGQGTEPLERAMSQKYEMMARHSVDMLSDRGQAEAVGTVRMKVSVQTATLADMARSVSRLLSQALTFAGQWAGINQPAIVKLNTEYSTEGIDPQEVTALMQGVIQGTIPILDFIRRLRKVGLIEADRKDEDVISDLALAAERDTGTLEV